MIVNRREATTIGTFCINRRKRKGARDHAVCHVTCWQFSVSVIWLWLMDHATIVLYILHSFPLFPCAFLYSSDFSFCTIFFFFLCVERKRIPPATVSRSVSDTGFQKLNREDDSLPDLLFCNYYKCQLWLSVLRKNNSMPFNRKEEVH